MAPAGTSTSQTSRITGITFGLATNTLNVRNNKQQQQHTPPHTQRAEGRGKSARNRKIVVDAVRETGETWAETKKNVEKKGFVQ